MQQLDPLIRLIGVYDDLAFDLRHFGRAILPHSAKGNVNPAQVEIEHGNGAARPLKDTKNKADKTQLSGFSWRRAVPPCQCRDLYGHLLCGFQSHAHQSGAPLQYIQALLSLSGRFGET